MRHEVLPEQKRLSAPNFNLVRQFEALKNRWPVHIDGSEHLGEVRAHIQKGGSVAILINHASMRDSPVVALSLGPAIGKLDFRTIILFSTKFFPDIYDNLKKDPSLASDPDVQQGLARHRAELKGVEAFLVKLSAPILGFEALPIVQHHRMGEGLFRRESTKIDLQTFAHVTEAIKQGPTVLGLSLEGTRSKEGVFLPAQGGIKRLFRDNLVKEKTRLLAVALEGVQKWNIVTPMKVHLDNLISYDRVIDEATTFTLNPEDILMLRIGAMLPAEMLGYYGDPQFRPYLDARISERATGK